MIHQELCISSLLIDVMKRQDGGAREDDKATDAPSTHTLRRNSALQLGTAQTSKNGIKLQLKP
jgi:hypothetical protein